MIALNDFFKKLKGIGKYADKMKISDKQGNYTNLQQTGQSFAVVDMQKDITFKFLQLLSDLTGWYFDKNQWSFDNFALYKFTKGSIKPNGKNFKELIAKNPLSWAMTSSIAIEYTLEKPDKLK